MGRQAASFKSWLDADPTVVLTMGVALGMALLYMLKFLRGNEDEPRPRRPQVATETARQTEKPRESDLMSPSPEQTLHLIKNRRSIMPKDYVDAGDNPVTEKELNMILEAANWAPTHGKTEPWRYVVLSGPEAILSYLDYLEDWYQARKDTLSDEAITKFSTKLEGVRKQWPGNVSKLLLICMKRKALEEKIMPEWEEMCAVAMSVQNAHLMASSLGLGMFWSSHTWCKDCRDGPDLKKRLGFEEDDKILGALTLGRYKEGAKFRSTRNPVAEKVQRRAEM